MSCMIGAVLGTAVILIGTVLSVIAVAVPYWTLVKNQHTYEDNVVQGLFEICFKDLCITLDSLETVSLPDEVTICRVTNIAGIALGLITCLTSLQWLIKTRISSEKKSWLPALIFAASLLAAILVTLTLAIYGIQLYDPAKDQARLGYAVYLNAVGAFLFLVGGIVHRVASGRYIMMSYPELDSGQTMFAEPSGPLHFYNLQQEDKACYRGLVYQQPRGTVLERPLPYTDYTQKEHTYVAHLKQDLPQEQNVTHLEQDLPQEQNATHLEQDLPEEQYTAHLQRNLPEEQYTAHLQRNLPEEQYTPGETRKAAPGSSSI